MIFCSNISVSFDFFVPPVPVYIQRNTRPDNSRRGRPSKPVWGSESSVPSDRPVQPTRPSKPAYSTDLADPSDLTDRPV
ncbi:hypothetical protein BpHYR1_054422 [Brachionus plicatilis]|uniref:Uncharacterized protein n=1 Tax=Brachionus plicatilis TaxID=10195 RepID=A0A3M7SEI1_BRAPC|nr:hypothetical protein BpHYR1_054422 [Brachionus plicatilis]